MAIGKTRSVLLLGLPLVLAASTLAVLADRAEPAQATTALRGNLKWSVNFGIKGKPVAGSSPTVANLDGKGLAVLVGDRAGYERAYRLSNGAQVAGWPASTGGTAIDSTASVLGSGAAATIFVGVGNSANPRDGAYLALSAGGNKLWSVHPEFKPSLAAGTVGVMSSMAIGNVSGTNDVVGGAMGQEMYTMASTNGKAKTGFPWFQADTNFSTPAIADLTNAGHNEIISGGDATAGTAFGYRYSNGGHIRIIGRLGNAASTSPAGGLNCQYNTTQVVQSSPVTGKIFAGGRYGIIAGTGSYYPGATDSNKLIAIDTNCKLKWKDDLHGFTGSSPALANVRGTGKNYVVQGTRVDAHHGAVYVLDPISGDKLWSATIPGGVYGGITTADLSGRGYQDVIAPTPTGTYILDGKTGARVATLGVGTGVQSSALVTADPDGTIGITIGGYNAYNQGMLLHYSIAGSHASRVYVAGAWPMFHHDQKLTGNAQTKLTAP